MQPLQKAQLQPPSGPSVDSLCHPCITTTHLSYSVLSLKPSPPPRAVLLENNLFAWRMSTLYFFLAAHPDINAMNIDLFFGGTPLPCWEHTVLYYPRNILSTCLGVTATMFQELVGRSRGSAASFRGACPIQSFGSCSGENSPWWGYCCQHHTIRCMAWACMPGLAQDRANQNFPHQREFER